MANSQPLSPSQYLQSLATAGQQGTSTQGYANPPAGEPVDNLPFDNRMTGRMSGRSPILGNLLSGAMYTVQKPVYTCYFLFNPNEIDKSYSFDSSIPLPPQDLSTNGAAMGAGTVLNQTVSFTMLFDRTFEVWTGPKGQRAQSGGYTGAGPYQFGVQWDIWAVERLLGIYGQAYGTHTPSGPPLAQICQVDFANPGNPQNPVDSANPGAVTFQGWIQSLDVQYTRFDINMTPTRAAVNMAFQLVYALPGFLPDTGLSNPGTNPGTTAGAAAAGSAKSQGSSLPGRPRS